MFVRAWIGVGLGVALTVLACGSGGGDPGTTSSGDGGSSGGGASGGAACEAICYSSARVSFDEQNDSERLVGITVETCHEGECATGTVKKTDAASGYTLEFVSNPGARDVRTSITPLPDGKLRFEVRWRFGTGAASGTPKDGDRFEVRGYFGGDGANTFEHTFTATYRDETVCQTTCKVFEAGPQ